jgi:phosphate transport system permease protein
MTTRVSKKRRDVHKGDQRFFLSLRAIALLIILVFSAIVTQLARLSAPAFSHFGPGFLFQSNWDPVNEQFGGASFLFGTLVSSVIALLISVPVSIGVALFLTELAPKRVASFMGFLVEMLAAIPSVVYGLWGVFVLAPILRTDVEPFLKHHLGFVPLFQGAPYGVGMMAAGIILAIMITPTISAICREVFSAVSNSQREAALALGATRWEMIRLSVLRGVRPGILGRDRTFAFCRVPCDQ